MEYALPLVIRVEREMPPSRTDALECAARAVLIFATDPRTADGEWTERVRAWEDGHIRKVVRRARGAAWLRAAALPGITVTHGTAGLRVYPPVPVDAWPEDLARLQVAGTDLSDPSPPGEPPAGTPVIWINPGAEMTAGKAMAQAGHGAQLAWWRLTDAARAQWHARDFVLAVRTASAARWKELLASDLPVVRDGGFTEVEPGTCTVIAEYRPLAPVPPAPPGQNDLSTRSRPAGWFCP